MSTYQPLTTTATLPAAATSIIGPGRLDALLNESECRRFVLSIHYPTGPICPRCNFSALPEGIVERFWAGSRFICPSCLQKVSPTSGTLLHKTPLTAAQIVLIAIGISSEVRNEIIAARVGVVPETVRTWAQKFAALQELRQQ